MNFREYIKDNLIYFDGGMGTLLQQRGLCAGENPEMWNLTHQTEVTEIHKAYFDAGSNVVTANTFGANCLKFSDSQLEEIIKAAIKNARTALQMSTNNGEKFIALDLGPTGKLLKPLGDLDFEKAVEIFAKTVKLGEKYGADLIIIETMNDSYETKAALLAAKENSNLPTVVTNAYGEDKKLMTGATPAAMAVMLSSMGADMLGANCSLGPEQLTSVIEELLLYSDVPVVVQPNAGLPIIKDGKTVYDVTAEEFAKSLCTLIEKGVRGVGGCCGTTPQYIKELTERSGAIPVKAVEKKDYTAVSSYTNAVFFGSSPLLIGERINPTGKKRFKEAIKSGDMDYILSEGVSQQEKGVHILDVNVGLPEIDEAKMLKTAVSQLQEVTDLPLQIDTSDHVALEAALRIYNGKALINSVNGKKESMEAVFPLVKKYGGTVIALTLDEKGIPETASGRVEIAKRILSCAREYGIDKKDIVFDTLALTVSADNKAGLGTLEALNIIKKELGCHTSLGVSNVSFGLPSRDIINSTFFALALENGLSAAIMNPYSDEMMNTYYAYRALKGMDENCAEYINSCVKVEQKEENEETTPLGTAIIKGFKEKAGEITKQLIKCENPLDIVNNHIIPALNTVGKAYEEKRAYLPSLLISAEAAKSAFEVIKAAVNANDNTPRKGKVVIATVKGDIHDIGKNILKLLLENYGFAVVDLGKDVPPEEVLKAVQREKASLVGLSALMTTTVPAMEETVKLLKEEVPDCKVMVGGAVLTKEYSDKIGADKYAKDAMEGVRYAEEIMSK